MQRSVTCLLLAVLTHGGGGVTKTSGIDQFWTDDYKIFGQIYGKTSDKDIYGSTLPETITFTHNDKKKDASEKNERYLIKDYNDAIGNLHDTYNFGNQYTNLASQLPLKHLSRKPAKSSINFVSYPNVKPISQANDPDAYNYLKHLEEFHKEDKYEFPKTMGGFRPYLMYGATDPEETDAYKSIQDILEAHEGNKAKANFKIEDEDSFKIMTNSKIKRKKPPRLYNELKPRCIGNRCRNRGPVKSRSRPYHRRSPSAVKTVVVI